MTYKEAINRFRGLYRINALRTKTTEVNLDDKEILMLLSIPYADLCNNERLIEGYKLVRLTTDDYDIDMGAGTGQIPFDLLDIRTIKFAEGYSAEKELEEWAINEIPSGERSSGTPTKYTLYYANGNKILYLDKKPDDTFTSTNGYFLAVYYWKKIFPYSGIAENTFSDVDFTATGFGGSFLNETIFDNVIILGALKEVIPEKTNEYITAYQEAVKKQPVSISSKLTYSLGA